MKPSEIIAEEIRNAECPMSDRLAKALEAVEQLEQQGDLLLTAIKQALWYMANPAKADSILRQAMAEISPK